MIPSSFLEQGKGRKSVTGCSSMSTCAVSSSFVTCMMLLRGRLSLIPARRTGNLAAVTADQSNSMSLAANLLLSLQDVDHSGCSCNVYCVPPSSQGSDPHLYLKYPTFIEALAQFSAKDPKITPCALGTTSSPGLVTGAVRYKLALSLAAPLPAAGCTSSRGEWTHSGWWPTMIKAHPIVVAVLQVQTRY